MSKSFADLGVSRAVAGGLAGRGIDTPFPIQELVVPDALAGHDVLAKSPTGSGKTLAFAIPVVDGVAAEARRPAALVLAPTRELAQQIEEEMRPLAHARALSVTAVYGGAGLQKQAKLASKSHIVVATPGRLEDLIARRAVTLQHIAILVLDEADRMLDMGFRPVVDRLVKQMPARSQTLFFSATLDGEVGRLAKVYTRDARMHEHGASEQTRPIVGHRFLSVAHEAKLDALVKEIQGEHGGRTLVFVRTKRGADRLAKRLKARGVEAAAIHGDRTQGQRERALAQFASGKVETLVATDVAARGIHVDDVAHVVNFDVPEDREAYVHRTGRTGRAGRRGIATTFVLGDQAHDMGRIAADLDLHDEFASAGFSAGRNGNGARNGPGARSVARSRPPRGRGRSTRRR